MFLDIRTLLGIAFAHSLTFGLIFLLIHGDYNGQMRQCMRTWGRAHLLAAAGWALVAGRGIVPEAASILLGNGFLLYAQSEIVQALRLFDNRRPARKWAIPPALGGILPVAYFSFFSNSLASRVVVISLVVALQHAVAALHARPVGGEMNSRSRLITSLGFWGLSALFLMRALYTLVQGANLVSALENSSMQSIVFGGGIFGMVLISYGFLFMCHEKFSSELKRLAAIDPLTGLYNRRALEEIAQREISRARRKGESFLYMIIDMDLFKRINDSFGHAVGDTALKQVASTLRNSLRSQDVIGRLGGDEFAVLLPSTDRSTGETIAGRLSSNILATPFFHNGQSIEMRVSIGISEFRPEDGELEGVMCQADKELYIVKKRKKLTAV